MKHIIDPELILGAPADYKYGRRLGLTDEETERSALETMDAMRKAYDKTLPMQPVNDRCTGCNSDVRNWTGDEPFNFCPNCGKAIDWEVSE